MNRRDALKSLLALPAVGSVAVAHVTPADTIVLTLAKGHFCDEQMDHAIKAYAAQVFPGCRVCVLEHGMTLSVVRTPSL